eukprot:1096528-Amorphochlora_amoeboformis.AAC.1
MWLIADKPPYQLGATAGVVSRSRMATSAPRFSMAGRRARMVRGKGFTEESLGWRLAIGVGYTVLLANVYSQVSRAEIPGPMMSIKDGKFDDYRWKE